MIQTINKPKEEDRIGFSCAYTPVPLISAAGFTPYRVLPEGSSVQQAGHILHDNLCSHVKRILDRCLAQDLPKLAGWVFVNTCDAMRRLAGTLKSLKPDQNIITIEFPSSNNRRASEFVAEEFLKLANTLSVWRGEPIKKSKIEEHIELYNELYKLIEKFRSNNREGAGRGSMLQRVYNFASANSVYETIEYVKKLLTKSRLSLNKNHGIKVFLLGNILPDPRAFELFESCGADIYEDDLCTGSRSLNYTKIDPLKSIYLNLAESAYARTPCPRTINTNRLGRIPERIIAKVREIDARGIICHTLKFCDPYLYRLPFLRAELQKQSIPFLVLEGDCTMGSIEQHRTRIEAFIEMLR